MGFSLGRTVVLVCKCKFRIPIQLGVGVISEPRSKPSVALEDSSSWSSEDSLVFEGCSLGYWAWNHYENISSLWWQDPGYFTILKRKCLDVSLVGEVAAMKLSLGSLFVQVGLIKKEMIIAS